MAPPKLPPLHQAAKDGELAAVQAVLNGGDARGELERRDGSRRTALHLACWAGHLEVVKALCVAGAKVNAPAMDDVLPIHFAAMKGHTDVVKVLLLSGANASSRSRKMVTPLHFAAQGGHAETVNLLLRKHASTKATNKQGKTAQEVASNDAVRAAFAAAGGQAAPPAAASTEPGSVPEPAAVVIPAEDVTIEAATRNTSEKSTSSKFRQRKRVDRPGDEEPEETDQDEAGNEGTEQKAAVIGPAEPLKKKKKQVTASVNLSFDHLDGEEES